MWFYDAGLIGCNPWLMYNVTSWIRVWALGCEQEGVYLENVTTQLVRNEAAVLALLAKGSIARTKGETQVTRC